MAKISALVEKPVLVRLEADNDSDNPEDKNFKRSYEILEQIIAYLKEKEYKFVALSDKPSTTGLPSQALQKFSFSVQNAESVAKKVREYVTLDQEEGNKDEGANERHKEVFDKFTLPFMAGYLMQIAVYQENGEKFEPKTFSETYNFDDDPAHDVYATLSIERSSRGKITIGGMQKEEVMERTHKGKTGRKIMSKRKWSLDAKSVEELIGYVQSEFLASE